MSDSLALMATNLQSKKVPQQLGVAVLSQIQGLQKINAQALISMINATTSITADGAGQIVNVGV